MIHALKLIAIALIPGCIFGGCVATHNMEYSNGQRDGVLQAVSEKGLLWKTLEGELAMDGVKIKGGRDSVRGGSVLSFSVLDRSLFEKLNSIPNGERVRLKYKKVVWCGPWISKTSYHVYDVEAVAK